MKYTKLEKLGKDVLYTIAMELDCIDVLAYCKTNTRINEKVCDNIYFMRNKLMKDFGFSYNGKDTKLANKYHSFLCKNKNESLGYQTLLASKIGYQDLVEYFFNKGGYLTEGLYEAANIGDMKMVEYLVKNGDNDWYWGIKGAINGGHKDLVEYFINKSGYDMADERTINDLIMLAKTKEYYDIADYLTDYLQSSIDSSYKSIDQSIDQSIDSISFDLRNM